MFRDKDEALARLEEELLEEELPEEELAEDEAEFFEEPSGDTSEYHNFANNYGKKIKAYNNDTTDTDLDAFSEEVYHAPTRRPMRLLLVAMLLLFGIFCVLAWWFLRYRGIIG